MREYIAEVSNEGVHETWGVRARSKRHAEGKLQSLGGVSLVIEIRELKLKDTPIQRFWKAG